MGTRTSKPKLAYCRSRGDKTGGDAHLHERFPDSRIEAVERYARGEGSEGTVKRGRFVAAGQELVAMDSHIEHDTTFSEAISLQVMCRNQAEVARHWSALSEGGREGPCGWLKDRYGVSWQIVPACIPDWMSSGDVAAVERAFDAVMRMKKPHSAAIQAAFDGIA